MSAGRALYSTAEVQACADGQRELRNNWSSTFSQKIELKLFLKLPLPCAHVTIFLECIVDLLDHSANAERPV